MTVLLFIFQFFYVQAEPIALGRSEVAKKEPVKKEAAIKPPEWVQLEAQLQSLTTKIRQKQDNMERLIQEKRSTENRERLAEIIRELNNEQRNLVGFVTEYDQQRTLLKYRYPERKATERKKYEKIEMKPIEDVEAQSALGKKLQSTLSRVEKIYGTPRKTMDAPNALNDRMPASVNDFTAPKKSKKEKQQIKLIEETPILKK